MHAAAALSAALLMTGALTLHTHDSGPSSAPERATLSAAAPVIVTPYATTAENARAAALVARMTLAQKAGQVIVAAYDGDGSPADLVRKYHFGGVTPVARNISSRTQIARVVQSVQAAVRPRGYPAFVGIDQEGGRVARIGSAPSFMMAGAANRPALTTAMARAVGAEMRAMGFTSVMAPVADITTGASDPTIGTRSAGSRRVLVAQQSVAALRGLDAAGEVPVVKHFPGHGSVSTDTHEDLAVQHRSLAQLRERDLYPFQQAISAGVPAIMTGHIVVRAVDPKLPATLSRKVTTGLLRQQMGFRGLVITDSLGMGAIDRHWSSGSAAVLSLRAGADVVLMPRSAPVARGAIVSAVRQGTLSAARLDEAATRMIATLLHQVGVEPAGARWGSSQAAQAALARAGLTQVAGRCSGRLVGPSIRVVGPHKAALTRAARSAGLQVGTTGRLVSLATTRVPAPAHVAVALDRPHVLGRAKAPIKIAAYGHAPVVLKAVVRRLLGQSVAPGRLPTSAGAVPRAGC